MPSRLIIGLVGSVLTVGCMLTGGLPIMLFLAFVTVLAVFEMNKITDIQGYEVNLPIALLGSIAFLIDAVVTGGAYAGLVFVIVLIVSSFLRIKSGVTEKSIENIALTLFTIFYCGFCVSKFYLIREMGFGVALMTLGMVWLNDIFALSFGSMFGKTKLSPNISPKKTIEGSLGGVLGVLVVMICLKIFASFSGLFDMPSVAAIILLSLSFTLIGQLGDLTESSIKRQAGIKDSGTVLFSHGGILDRFDSFIFVMPLAYYIFTIIK